MAFCGGDSLEIWNQCVSKLDLQMCSSVIWHVSLTFRQLRKRAWVNGSQKLKYKWYLGSLNVNENGNYCLLSLSLSLSFFCIIYSAL